MYIPFLNPYKNATCKTAGCNIQPFSSGGVQVIDDSPLSGVTRLLEMKGQVGGGGRGDFLREQIWPIGTV